MMKKRLLLFLLFPVLLSSCIEDEDDKKSPESKIQIGDVLPSFAVKSLDNVAFSSSGLKDKVALIVLFDVTCKDCRRELPKADSLYRHYAGNPDFVLLPVARAQSADEVGAYWHRTDSVLKLPFTMPAYIEYSPHEVYNLFAEKLVPRFYLARKDGRVYWLGAEVIKENVADLQGKIDTLLSE